MTKLPSAGHAAARGGQTVVRTDGDADGLEDTLSGEPSQETAPPPDPALPFRPGTAAISPSWPVQHEGAGKTAMWPAAVVAAGLPFQSRDPFDGEPLRYASYVATMAMFPEAQLETMARFGVVPGRHVALTVEWQSRLGADPALRVRFEEARAAYEAWLADPRRRS